MWEGQPRIEPASLRRFKGVDNMLIWMMEIRQQLPDKDADDGALPF